MNLAPRKSLIFLVLLTIGLSLTIVIINGTQNAVSADNSKSVTETKLYLPVSYQPYPPPSNISFVRIAQNFSFSSDTITDITHANDDRLFILEKNGIVHVMQSDGTISQDVFLDIRNDVFYDPKVNWELGALGLAFHPEFPTKPYVYISYNSKDRYRISLDRYTVDPNNPDKADINSRMRILLIPKSQDNSNPSPVHNGGDLAFGPDEYLYMGTGDGGLDPHFGSPVPPPDQYNHGQRLDVLLGKVLRIDVDKKPTNLPPQCNILTGPENKNNYSIPADNPFVGVDGCDEIWARGLRNAWRISFDRLMGELYISDVGEWINEEINVEKAGFEGGANYGWRCYEGTYDQAVEHPEHAAKCYALPISAYTFPTYEYSHAATKGCGITGGFVYRGDKYPMLQGYYVFSDFCQGQIWALQRGTDKPLEVGNMAFIGTFGEGYDGELYAGTWSPSGFAVLYRLEAE